VKVTPVFSIVTGCTPLLQLPCQLKGLPWAACNGVGGCRW